MEPVFSLIVTVFTTALTSIMASTGFWAFMQYRHEQKRKKAGLTDMDENFRNLVLGSVKERIMHVCTGYLERGWIGQYEMEILLEDLYDPYVKNGGNGYIKILVEECKKLPIVSNEHMEGIDDVKKRECMCPREHV